MGKFKRVVSGLLALVMVIGLGSVSLADTGNQKIDWLVENKFVVGNEDGQLNLENNLTREEAATIIVKALGKETLAPSYQKLESEFTDMNTSIWSNGMVNVAVELKVVNGYLDKSFKPKNKITYQEIIVMLVQAKGGITAAERDSAPWPTPYIAKAQTLGIMDGVNISDVKANATRLKSFELLYNTVFDDFEQTDEAQTYTALVTEIDRVHPIAKNEMGLYILDAKADNKYEAKQYTRVTFENIDKYEDLLGKVIKVDLDKDNKIKKYEVDNSYEYLMGNVEFDMDSVTLNGKTYDVLLNDTAVNVSNKVQFVYHNDEAVVYSDLLNNYDSDFARITVDKNRVIAIESFDFSEVEPIEKIDGNMVTFINGRTLAIDKTLLLDKNILNSGELKDVKNLDIGHVYGANKLLVSRDVELTGKLETVVSNRGNDVVVDIGGKEYKVSDKFDMLYSSDGKNFIRLDSKKAYDDLYALRGESVVYGLDASNNIKYLVSAGVSNEDFYIVDRSLRDEVRLVDTSGKKVDLELDLRSTIEDNSGNRIGVMNLKPGDLVYLRMDGNYVEKLILVEKYSDIKKTSVSIGKDSKGEFVLDRRFELTSNPKSFIFHEDSKGLKEVTAMEVEKVLANSKSDSKLKAYMFSDYDFDDLNLSKDVITSGDKNMINLLIFTGFEQSVEEAREEVVRLRYDFRSNYDDELVGYIGSTSVNLKLKKNAKLNTMKTGDYVKVYLDSQDEIIEGELLFKEADKFVEVLDLDTRAGKLLEITVKVNNRERTYLTSDDLIEMGRTEKGSQIKYHLNSDGQVDVVLVK